MNGTATQIGNLPDGFTVHEVADFLLKKSFWRLNTNVGTALYNEPYSTPNVFPGQIATDTIPQVPPTDFVKITDNAVCASLFGIHVTELSKFNTFVKGVNQFSVECSVSYPYIYKINKCLLSPIPSNPNYAFGGNTSVTRVNILDNVIPFYYGEGAWKGTIYRTMAGAELSRGGIDQVKESQVAYMFDYDSGVFTLYDPDSTRFTQNPITSAHPPSISCYVYKGRFGNFTGDFQSTINDILADILILQNKPEIWSQQGDTAYYTKGAVSIGSNAVSDPSVLFYVVGTGSINNVLTQSVETYSDRRLKENIVLYPVNKDILSLNTYTYNYKSKPGDTDIGVIAQEVEAIVPHIVKEHGGMKTVQYDRFGVLLLPIVKEQQERIERLEEELYAFKTLLAKLST
jgi:hypothetical protein